VPQLTVYDFGRALTDGQNMLPLIGTSLFFDDFSGNWVAFFRRRPDILHRDIVPVRNRIPKSTKTPRA